MNLAARNLIALKAMKQEPEVVLGRNHLRVKKRVLRDTRFLCI